MFKKEKEFQRWFGQQCKKKKWFYFKIPDDSRWMKPYDCIVRTDNEDLHIELKMVPSLEKITGAKAWALLRPQQKAALWKITKLGGTAIISVYWKKENQTSSYVLYNSNWDQWFYHSTRLSYPEFS